MNWINVKNKLPEPDERVLVWMKYEGDSEFDWNDSELDNPEHSHYIEPNSQRGWLMGSATNYIITHWARVAPPKNI